MKDPARAGRFILKHKKKDMNKILIPYIGRR